MAVNFKPLNRNQTWSEDQKIVYRRLFNLAFAAAAPSVSASISRSIVNRTLAGKLDATEEQDIRSLFIGLRVAIDADNTSYDLQQHFGADRYTGRKRRIVKAMAQTVVDAISAS
jgi:hypothetical protein